MTEQNKFIKIDTIPLYDDSIGAVSLYDASHANESEEQRIWTVTTIASLAYGNEEAKNPEALYERMKSIKHESLWEFIRDGNAPYTVTGSMRGVYGKTIKEYLIENTSVKYHKQNIACFRIKVPLFIRAQFMRHRSFSYLEMSRRYTKGAKIPFEFWFPKEYNELDKYVFMLNFNGTYEHFISRRYETQVASRFLPQATYTEFYVMGEVEGLKNFFRLRCDSHAQAEIREVAEAMLELLRIHQPELYRKVLPS
jgi:thymidylate synthase (FAD)